MPCEPERSAVTGQCLERRRGCNGVSVSPIRDICVMPQYFLCVRPRGGFAKVRWNQVYERGLHVRLMVRAHSVRPRHARDVGKPLAPLPSARLFQKNAAMIQ